MLKDYPLLLEPTNKDEDSAQSRLSFVGQFRAAASMSPFNMKLKHNCFNGKLELIVLSQDGSKCCIFWMVHVHVLTGRFLDFFAVDYKDRIARNGIRIHYVWRISKRVKRMAKAAFTTTN